MSQHSDLQSVYLHPAVREIGRALRIALWRQSDFSSLVDLDGAERPEDFAEAVKRFLRRFDALARRYRFQRPTQQALEDLMGLIDAHGVKVVRAAIISHSLVRSASREAGVEESIEEGDNVGES